MDLNLYLAGSSGLSREFYNEICQIFPISVEQIETQMLAVYYDLNLYQMV